MPRPQTMLSETRRWLRDNATWLGKDHAPLVQQLKMLAKTMDSDMTLTGKVPSATASAYRHTYTTLIGLRPDPDDLPPAAPAAPTIDQADADDDALFEPR